MACLRLIRVENRNASAHQRISGKPFDKLKAMSPVEWPFGLELWAERLNANYDTVSRAGGAL